MASFFGRGGSNNNQSSNDNNNNNNNSSSGYGGSGNTGYSTTAGNNNSSSMSRSGSNSGYTNTSSNPSQFGSINNDEMDKASISTFGGGTSVASGNDYSSGGNNKQQQSSNNNSNNNSGGGVSLGGIANEMIGGRGGGNSGNQQQQSSSGGNNNSSSNNNQGRNSNFDDDSLSSGAQNMSVSGGNNNDINRSGGNNQSIQSGGNNQSGGSPIATAADFNSSTAEIIFLSGETGQGASRQPVTRFRVHEVNLNVHSNVLSEMADREDDNNNEEIVLEEDAATLKLLFGLMYNRPSPALTMSDWQVVLRMARAAQRYDVARAKEVAAAYFTEQEQLGALSPFMTYAFAVQYKLQALEESAAERSVRYDIHRLPELVFSMMGFSSYQKLSAFHAARQTHYQDVLNNIGMDPNALADQCYQSGGTCAIAPWNKLKVKLQSGGKSRKGQQKRALEPTDVLKLLVTEISQIDCGE